MCVWGGVEGRCLPSTGLRSVALLLPISEAKPRSAGRSQELSYFVVPEKGHGSWYVSHLLEEVPLRASQGAL
jgi:hypothetical protein